MQRKVGAAPHRGNANGPLTKQGKANTLRTLTKAPKRQRKKQSPTRHASSQKSAAQAKKTIKQLQQHSP
ncbi:hypothetical protein, partial [Paraburkholderia sediminicola]|uniref:hypothetical protein n=2 Tax=Paraburkholderia sediminicola TaxID=458836 RepID=UPI0038BBB627